ncbi:MAG: vitamin K epoxide reductase family protein [Balneolaceae bacterium]
MLSAIGLLDFIPVSLYQMGVIRHLPDIPVKWFDSDKVNASGDAHVAGMPDGPVSLMMYAANLVCTAGAIRRKKQWNVMDCLVAGNTLGQAAGGAYYLYKMAAEQKRVCLYCITGAAINFATVLPLYRLFRNRD